MNIKRCGWVGDDPLYIAYHDDEWCVPVHDDKVLFEFLILEGAQAGLSWITILRKRENYRIAFDNFDFEKIASYDEEKIVGLKNNVGIIRNLLKIKSAVKNANAFIKIREEFGTFDKYIWGFVDNKPIINNWEKYQDTPVSTKLSTEISKDLKKRGFSFIGPVICYSYLQAIGIIDDHTVDCFRKKSS